jgi:hypothetical protein
MAHRALSEVWPAGWVAACAKLPLPIAFCVALILKDLPVLVRF